MSNEIKIMKNDEVVCVCANESCLYPIHIMKDMKADGYKFYQDGKIYKLDNKEQYKIN